jgi:hypothetical protein
LRCSKQRAVEWLSDEKVCHAACKIRRHCTH